MEIQTSDIKLMIRECIDVLDRKIDTRLFSIESKLDEISNNELAHLTSNIAVMGNDICWIKKTYEELKKQPKNGSDPAGLARDTEAQTNISWLKDIVWKVVVPVLMLITGTAIGHFLLNK